MKRGLAIGLMVAIAVVVGVGAFFGGRATGGGGTPSPEAAIKVLQNLTADQRTQLFQNGGGLGSLFGGAAGRTGGTGTGARAGGGATSGSIVSKDSGSITVKSSDGNTKIVLFSGSTTISKTSDVTADALTVGQTVTVTGTANTDGSVTATRIFVGALGFGGPGQGGGTGTGSTQGGTSGGTGGNSSSPGTTPGGSTAPPSS